jgi:2-polyprenyl-3-methyl-5-hydroxy-6-metoxy-1,4-benzoquinol methylase
LNRPVLTRADLVRMVRHQLFVDCASGQRAIQGARAWICPFETLISFVPQGSTVLDVGCGSGMFLGILAATGAGITGVGVDVSPRAIETAKRMATRVKEHAPESSLEFLCLSPEAPWPGNGYGVVSAIDVLHHVPVEVQMKFLRGLFKQVKPGGILLYKDMASRPLWRAAGNVLHDLLSARELIHVVPIRAVESLAESAGFRLLASDDSATLWYGHEMRVFRAPES